MLEKHQKMDQQQHGQQKNARLLNPLSHLTRSTKIIQRSQKWVQWWRQRSQSWRWSQNENLRIWRRQRGSNLLDSVLQWLNRPITVQNLRSWRETKNWFSETQTRLKKKNTSLRITESEMAKNQRRIRKTSLRRKTMVGTRKVKIEAKKLKIVTIENRNANLAIKIA